MLRLFGNSGIKLFGISPLLKVLARATALSSDPARRGNAAIAATGLTFPANLSAFAMSSGPPNTVDATSNAFPAGSPNLYAKAFLATSRPAVTGDITPIAGANTSCPAPNNMRPGEPDFMFCKARRCKSAALWLASLRLCPYVERKSSSAMSYLLYNAAGLWCHFRLVALKTLQHARINELTSNVKALWVTGHFFCKLNRRKTFTAFTVAFTVHRVKL